MRLIVHDFSGHPFQAELARALAARGHEVLHVQCSSYVSGKGSFSASGAPNIRYESISLGQEFARYRFRRRVVHELRYAARFTRLASTFDPDLIISCNDPLIAKAAFGMWARARRVPWIFWLQDLYSVAMAQELGKRTRAGKALGSAFTAVEKWLLRRARAVVAITDDFDPTLDAWRIDRSRRSVIENWAPLDELPVRPRDNPWRSQAGLGDRFVFLYSGTLGLKHNPDLLYDLAAGDPSAEVVVISEGMGVDHLRDRLEAHPLSNLRLLPYQPYEVLPDALGAADVLVVLLEATAGRFAVPSKILTYLCAGRPILAAMPHENLGARTIHRAKAGIVVNPGENGAVTDAARTLRNDGALRAEMACNARSYAERAFEIDAVTDRFLAVIEGTQPTHREEV